MTPALKLPCLLTAFLLVAGLTASVRADHAGTFDYEVLRDGKPIGYNRVVARPIEAGAGLQLTYESELAVKFGFLTVFSYSHRRHETWRHGKLIRAVARTDNDGDRHLVEVSAEGGGYVRTVDGRREAMAPGRLPLTFWNLSALQKQHAFFSLADDKLPNLTITFAGSGEESWWPGDGPLAHYRISGDEDRDFWFDANDHLVRATFENRGSEIEYRLKRPLPTAPR